MIDDGAPTAAPFPACRAPLMFIIYYTCFSVRCKCFPINSTEKNISTLFRTAGKTASSNQATGLTWRRYFMLTIIAWPPALRNFIQLTCYPVQFLPLFVSSFEAGVRFAVHQLTLRRQSPDVISLPCAVPHAGQKCRAQGGCLPGGAYANIRFEDVCLDLAQIAE